jgi:hypothetical protein
MDLVILVAAVPAVLPMVQMETRLLQAMAQLAQQQP